MYKSFVCIEMFLIFTRTAANASELHKAFNKAILNVN